MKLRESSVFVETVVKYMKLGHKMYFVMLV